jgi:hypothetical protein
MRGGRGHVRLQGRCYAIKPTLTMGGNLLNLLNLLPGGHIT